MRAGPVVPYRGYPRDIYRALKHLGCLRWHGSYRCNLESGCVLRRTRTNDVGCKLARTREHMMAVDISGHG